MEATAESSIALPEPYRFDDGWRVETTCRSCHAGMFLDSPEKPNENALKIARSMMVCDECAAQLEGEEEARTGAIAFRKRLEASGLPADLHGLTWESMDRDGERRGVVVAARAWAESRKGRLFLTGSVGVGKTRLAATALWERLQREDAIWMPVASLMQWQFFPNSSAERRRAQLALASQVPLVLDDLGKEKPGDWARQIMFGAIDLRIQAGVPVILTSNLHADELTHRLGQGFGSRLRQFHQYELSGRDRRDLES